MYNGAFVACPDPIDFRAYTVINLYKDDNAYTLKGEASTVERPASATTWAKCSPPSATRTTWSWRWATRAAPAGSTTSGRLCSARWAPTATRSLSSTRSPASSIRRRRLLARALRSVAHHRARLGDTGAQAARQDPHLRGQRRQLLPHRLGLLCAGAARSARAEYDGAVAYGDRAEHCWNGDPKRRMPIRDCITTISIFRSFWSASKPQPRTART